MQGREKFVVVLVCDHPPADEYHSPFSMAYPQNIAELWATLKLGVEGMDPGIDCKSILAALRAVPLIIFLDLSSRD